MDLLFILILSIKGISCLGPLAIALITIASSEIISFELGSIGFEGVFQTDVGIQAQLEEADKALFGEKQDGFVIMESGPNAVTIGNIFSNMLYKYRDRGELHFYEQGIIANHPLIQAQKNTYAITKAYDFVYGLFSSSKNNEETYVEALPTVLEWSQEVKVHPWTQVRYIECRVGYGLMSKLYKMLGFKWGKPIPVFLETKLCRVKDQLHISAKVPIAENLFETVDEIVAISEQEKAEVENFLMLQEQVILKPTLKPKLAVTLAINSLSRTSWGQYLQENKTTIGLIAGTLVAGVGLYYMGAPRKIWNWLGGDSQAIKSYLQLKQATKKSMIENSKNPAVIAVLKNNMTALDKILRTADKISDQDIGMMVKACCLEGNQDALSTILNQYIERIRISRDLTMFIAKSLVNNLIPATFLKDLYEMVPNISQDQELCVMLYKKGLRGLGADTFVDFMDLIVPKGKTLEQVITDVEQLNKTDHVAVLNLLLVLQEPNRMTKERYNKICKLHSSLVEGVEKCMIKTNTQARIDQLLTILKTLMNDSGPLGNKEIMKEAGKLDLSILQQIKVQVQLKSREQIRITR